MLRFFRRPARREDLPDGQGWAMETVQLSTHNGTHLDAPYHYHPTMNRGERAWTIDEVPLEWCLQPGVKLDFRHFPDGYVATAKDVETELKRIGHTLSPLEIVVVNTSAGAKYGQQDFVNSGCGMGYEATMYLLERGVRLTGIDGWSWDAPFVYTAKKYAETKDASLIWEGHKAGRHIGYCHIEKLHNLELSALDRLHGVVLSGQDRTRFGGLDPGGRDHRGMKRKRVASCKLRRKRPDIAHSAPLIISSPQSSIPNGHRKRRIYFSFATTSGFAVQFRLLRTQARLQCPQGCKQADNQGQAKAEWRETL